MMQTLRSETQGAVNGSLIIDGFVSHTGDDMALIMTRTRGINDTTLHQFGFRDSARTNGKARASKRAGSRGK